MKYLAILLFAVLSVKAIAQPCTPYFLYADSLPGLYPDTLPDALQGQNGYTTTVELVNDTTTTVAGYYFVVAEKLCRIDTLFGGSVVAEGYNGNIGGLDAAVNAGSFPNYSPVQWCFTVSLSPTYINTVLGVNTSIYHPITFYVDKYVCDSSNNCAWLSQLGLLDCGQPYTTIVHILRLAGTDEINPNPFSVGASYPNPANAAVIIPYTTAKAQTVSITIYNTLGRLIHQANITSAAGQNNYTVNTSTLAPGMYICTVSNDKECITRKLFVE